LDGGKNRFKTSRIITQKRVKKREENDKKQSQNQACFLRKKALKISTKRRQKGMLFAEVSARKAF